MISEDDYENFPQAAQMRIRRMLIKFRRAERDDNFSRLVLLKPLDNCERYVRKLRRTQNATLRQQRHPVTARPKPQNEPNEEKKTKLRPEAVEVRVMAAAKHILKDPHVTNKELYEKFELADKTLSREPHKTMIHSAREAVKKRRKAIPHERRAAEGKKGSYRGRKEKGRKANLEEIPDHRRSHVDEVNGKIDDET